MITESGQVNPCAHDRPQSRSKDDSGQCAALQQRGRWSGRPDATAVNDHVDIDFAKSVERLGQVLPNPAEMHCTGGLCEAGQKKPTTLLLSRQWQCLAENRLSKWATVPGRLGNAEQAFATCRTTAKVAGKDCLMRSRIAVRKQDRPRPGEGQT